MTVTAQDFARAPKFEDFKAQCDALLGDGKQPSGPMLYVDGHYVQAYLTGAPVTADDQFDDTSVLARLNALEATVDTATTGLSDVVADHESRIAALEAA